MNRRELVILLGSVAMWPRISEAQQTSKPARIGWLGINIEAGDPRYREAFLQGLRDLGYIEGHTFIMEYRDAHGKPERFPALAAELVDLKVDVIVTAAGTLGALAAKQATTTIPVVFPLVGDPVADGLVTSLARPGGNVTGLSVVATELIGKWLELLTQAVPGISRVAFLLKPDAVPDRTRKEILKEADVAARVLGVRLQVVEARGPEDFDRAFSNMSEAHADALAVMVTPAFYVQQRRLVDLAAKNRLPTVFSDKDFVTAGGLMSYGPNFADLHRRAAIYVDQILKGTKPADLPVQQPTKFELVINLKTANALGLTVPQSLLARADEVIE